MTRVLRQLATLTLKDLRTALSVARPAVEYLAPYQTVCNYPVYFLLGLGEHQSIVAPDKSATQQNYLDQLKVLHDRGYITDSPEAALRKQIRSVAEIERDQAARDREQANQQ